jgi:hypothetical protein
MTAWYIYRMRKEDLVMEKRCEIRMGERETTAQDRPAIYSSFLRCALNCSISFFVHLILVEILIAGKRNRQWRGYT